ncbi:hypothetical protein ES702_03032 [subsurface metagenome]
MAPKDYLFVNKDSRSPSLSRNTGAEASLASRVNKHVQQQRFWKLSGPRRSWYRPFVRSDSSSSAPSPTHSETLPIEETADDRKRLSSDHQAPRTLKRSISARVSPVAAEQGPRSLTQELPTSANDVRLMRGKWPMPPELLTLISEPGNAVDAFNIVAVPLTPILVEVLQRHIKWALAASVTHFAVQEGVKRLLSVILQDKMRAAAFLAMATAQQKHVNALIFPNEQGPELYLYRATKMIREFIETHRGGLPPYILVDIVRLAMCEWISRNHDGARIHLSYASKLWDNFRPQEPVDHHVQEACSSEDIFFAIDVDEKPLLTLNWLPPLPAGPQPLPMRSDKDVSCRNTGFETSNLPESDCIWQLEHQLLKTSSPLTDILQTYIVGLKSIPDFSHLDFGSALTGPVWIMKRRLHAALHRLQSLDGSLPLVDDSIRRTLIIVLLLASTTLERRVARINTSRLAERLRESLESIEESRSSASTPQSNIDAREQLQSPGLWLWMYVAGLAAAKESPSLDRTRQRFTKRALVLAVRLCGPLASSHQIQKIMSAYLFFDNALGGTVENLAAMIASHSDVT